MTLDMHVEIGEPPLGDVFVVQWNDGTFSTKSGSYISEMYDMADTGYGDEVKQVLAADEHGDLVPVRVGEQERVKSDEEFPLYYAYAPIYAGTKKVGTVAYTDH